MSTDQYQAAINALENSNSKVKSELISKDIGRGLLATTNICKGEVILTINEPFIALPTNEKLSSVCYHCFKKTIATPSSALSTSASVNKTRTTQVLRKCTGCNVIGYCSKECQVQSWTAFHKHECKTLKKISPRVLPTPTHALLQILVLVQWASSPGSTAATASLRSRLAAVMALSSHRAELQKRTQAWTDISLQVEAAMYYAGFDRARAIEAQEVFCKMENNSFQILQADPDDSDGGDDGDDGAIIGYCFDETLALANHSCRPNALVRFSGRIATLSALGNIAEGEQVLISYIDHTVPDITARRAQLRDRYFFECECVRCSQRDAIGRGTERLFRDRAPAIEAAVKSFLSRHPRDELPTPGPGLTILGELRRMCAIEAEASVLDLEFGDDLWQNYQNAKEELSWLQVKLSS
ncbi:MYND finger [Phlyctema vagabunda]|uniref:MYND finger n=1 Tax=Phlyctema vagabunda TaxID=108571 RepID=A0ABR4P2M6_9HELO